MLHHWFVLLPEILLLLFFPVAACVEKFLQEKNSRTFFMLTQFFLGMSTAFSILFYNKSAFPELLQKTPLSTLFATAGAIVSWAWFYLSSKWFINKNQSPSKFYARCLIILLGLDIMVASASLLTLTIAATGISLSVYFLVLREWNKDKITQPLKIYVISSVCFMLFLWVGSLLLYGKSGSFSYEIIKDFLANKTIDAETIVACLLIVSAMMFMLAQVPFHQWFSALVGEGHLPASGFLVLVPPLLYVCVLIHLIRNCLWPLKDIILPVMTTFAFVSLYVGALSAHRENNMRKWVACIAVYGIGFTLVGLSDFSKSAIIASFAYLMITVLSLGGIYTVFLGMKSKGDYIREIEQINGFSEKRPYMSAALLVFIFSLIGMAPTLGFLGYLSVINNLIGQGEWLKITGLIMALLFLAGAGLQMIRAVYFEASSNKYDRPDKAIYIGLFINMVIILTSLLNPTWLMHDILVILGGLS